MRPVLVTLAILLAWGSAASAQHADERYVPETDPLVLANLAHWQDIKFGLLMHWGPYSQWGVVESWSICAEDEGWCTRSLEDYIEYKRRYEGLQRTFNPVRFDPAAWARAARDAGMKYVVFTTKHHDGFSMFDSKYTDYKVTSPESPFRTNSKANIAKEVFDAFRAQGLLVGAYFSKPDWHSEYYWWPNFATPDRNVNYDPAQYPDRWKAFVEFTHNQVLELMSDHGKNQNYLTPENRVPDKPLPYPWESCIISGGGWSFTPGAKYMSGREAVHLLVDIVAKGGNLLLNVAPGPDGAWQQGAYDLLREMGAWIKVNGPAIYESRPIAPYTDGKIRMTSQKDGSVFFLYLADENETVMPKEIRIASHRPVEGARVTLLGTSAQLTWRAEGDGFVVAIPGSVRVKAPCRYAWAIKVSTLR